MDIPTRVTLYVTSTFMMGHKKAGTERLITPATPFNMIKVILTYLGFSFLEQLKHTCVWQCFIETFEHSELLAEKFYTLYKLVHYYIEITHEY